MVLVTSPCLSLLSVSMYSYLGKIGRLLKGFVTPPPPRNRPSAKTRPDFPSPAHPLESVDIQEEITVAQVSGKLNKDLWREFNKHLVAIRAGTPWRYLRRQFTTTREDARAKCAPCANLHTYDNISLTNTYAARWKTYWHSIKEIVAATELTAPTPQNHVFEQIRQPISVYGYASY